MLLPYSRPKVLTKTLPQAFRPPVQSSQVELGREEKSKTLRFDKITIAETLEELKKQLLTCNASDLIEILQAPKAQLFALLKEKLSLSDIRLLCIAGNLPHVELLLKNNKSGFQAAITLGTNTPAVVAQLCDNLVRNYDSKSIMSSDDSDKENTYCNQTATPINISEVLERLKSYQKALDEYLLCFCPRSTAWTPVVWKMHKNIERLEQQLDTSKKGDKSTRSPIPNFVSNIQPLPPIKKDTPLPLAETKAVRVPPLPISQISH